MGKSLITRLNASVNRDDLPVLGKIRINVTGTDNTAQSSGVIGSIKIIGSALTWKGTGRCDINSADKMLKTVDNAQKYYEFYDCGYAVLKLEDKITDFIIDNNIEKGHIFTKEELGY